MRASRPWLLLLCLLAACTLPARSRIPPTPFSAPLASDSTSSPAASLASPLPPSPSPVPSSTPSPVASQAPEPTQSGPSTTLYFPLISVAFPPKPPAGEEKQPEPQPPVPTSEPPPCISNLTYLEDLTVPDGSTVEPGELVDKRWKVENSGTCNWDGRYRLRLTAGPALGDSTEAALYPARSGAQAELRLVFTAPREPGTYRSSWQAADPEGRPFGDSIFIEIVVK